MPTLNRASAWVLASSLAFAGIVAAQAQQAPLAEPKAAVPVTPAIPGGDAQHAHPADRSAERGAGGAGIRYCEVMFAARAMRV